MKFYLRTTTPQKQSINNNSCSLTKQTINEKKCCTGKPTCSKPYTHAIPVSKPPPKTPPSKSPCHGPKPHLKNKKISFKALKKNTITSLNEVEHFLCNFQNIYKYIKLYKILK